jgi:predicted MFS family arabinose efflux permease
VLTIQVGITIGAVYGSPALVIAGPIMVPVAAALPVAVALVITLAGRRHAYPPGRKESGASEPEVREAVPPR